MTGSVTGLVLCIAALFSNAAMISTTGKGRRRRPAGDQAVLLLQESEFGMLLWLGHGLVCCATHCHDQNHWQVAMVQCKEILQLLFGTCAESGTACVQQFTNFW